MNVGATEQEVLESKKLDLTKRDRDYSSRRENNRARENNTNTRNIVRLCNRVIV